MRVEAGRRLSTKEVPPEIERRDMVTKTVARVWKIMIAVAEGRRVLRFRKSVTSCVGFFSAKNQQLAKKIEKLRGGGETHGFRRAIIRNHGTLKFTTKEFAIRY